ncbi:hypothetical protein DFJ73DRAFT_887836 [Zopfochytrium polystomum]|nr:hypothetical protein DFJ73DRAFT_887836 [Zopfochytrium polystomum]
MSNYSASAGRGSAGAITSNSNRTFPLPIRRRSHQQQQQQQAQYQQLPNSPQVHQQHLRKGLRSFNAYADAVVQALACVHLPTDGFPNLASQPSLSQPLPPFTPSSSAAAPGGEAAVGTRTPQSTAPAVPPPLGHARRRISSAVSISYQPLSGGPRPTPAAVASDPFTVPMRWSFRDMGFSGAATAALPTATAVAGGGAPYSSSPPKLPSSSLAAALTSVTQTGTSRSSDLPSQFDDLFKCYICFDNMKRPVMCPSCSKIGCFDCVEKWLAQERNQCPHCRAPLSSSQLVHCRFMDDLAQLRGAMSDAVKTSVSQSGECTAHSAPMFYYCQTCSEALCSDCAVIDQKHKEHKLERLQSVYKEKRQLLENIMSAFQEKMQNLCTVDSLFAAAADQINQSYKDFTTLQKAQFDQAVIHGEYQLTEKGRDLQALKSTLRHEVEDTRMTVDLLRKFVYDSSQVDLIDKAQFISNLGHEQLQAPTTTLLSTKAPEFESNMIPPYQTNTFKIAQFTTLQEANSVAFSEPFRSSGLTWRLKVYCSGNGQSRGLYLSVFMELMKGYARAQYQYRIELVLQNLPTTGIAPQLVAREFTSEFESGECWGYNRFHRLSMLVPQGFLAPEKDVLEIRFSVRPVNYAILSRDLSQYAKELEETIAKADSSNTNAESGDAKDIPRDSGVELATTAREVSGNDLSRQDCSSHIANDNGHLPTATAKEHSVDTLHTNGEYSDDLTSREPRFGHASLSQSSVNGPQELRDVLSTAMSLARPSSTPVYEASLASHADWTDHHFQRSMDAEPMLERFGRDEDSVNRARPDRSEELDDFFDRLYGQFEVLQTRVERMGARQAGRLSIFPPHSSGTSRTHRRDDSGPSVTTSSLSDATPISNDDMEESGSESDTIEPSPPPTLGPLAALQIRANRMRLAALLEDSFDEEDLDDSLAERRHRRSDPRQALRSVYREQTRPSSSTTPSFDIELLRGASSLSGRAYDAGSVESMFDAIMGRTDGFGHDGDDILSHSPPRSYSPSEEHESDASSDEPFADAEGPSPGQTSPLVFSNGEDQTGSSPPTERTRGEISEEPADAGGTWELEGQRRESGFIVPTRRAACNGPVGPASTSVTSTLLSSSLMSGTVELADAPLIEFGSDLEGEGPLADEVEEASEHSNSRDRAGVSRALGEAGTGSLTLFRQKTQGTFAMPAAAPSSVGGERGGALSYRIRRGPGTPSPGAAVAAPASGAAEGTVGEATSGGSSSRGCRDRRLGGSDFADRDGFQ